MRILFLTNIFPTAARPTGGSYVAERAEAHRRAGHEVEVVALRMRPDLLLRTALRRTGRDDESGPVPGMRVADYRISSREFVQRWWGRDSRKLATRAADAVQKVVNPADFDVIHAHGMFRPPAGLVARILSQRSGVPYVVTAHGTDVNRGMEKRPQEFIDTFAGARAAIFVSEALRSRAVELGASVENTHVITNGVDLSVFTPGPEQRDPLVLFVGNLARIKGADRLVGMWPSVRAAVPGARLMIIGSGSLADTLEDAFTTDDAELAGHQPREAVAEAMRKAACLVVPSRSESWGCVILEAQASGTPVVATEVGGIPDALGDGGVLVPAEGDVEQALASAVVSTLGTDIDREALRRRAEGFGWDEIARQEREVMG